MSTPANTRPKKSTTLSKKQSGKPSAAELNEGLTAFIITDGGKEPASAFSDKALRIAQITKRKGAVIQHHYSAPCNEHAKIVRFHIHISQADSETPVLWLSRNQYKTCRPGHKYFQLHKMESSNGQWTAAWRNMTFKLSPKLDYVQVEAVNDSSEFDLWTMTSPGKKRSDKLSLTPAKSN